MLPKYLIMLLIDHFSVTSNIIKLLDHYERLTDKDINSNAGQCFLNPWKEIFVKTAKKKKKINSNKCQRPYLANIMTVLLIRTKQASLKIS